MRGLLLFMLIMIVWLATMVLVFASLAGKAFAGGTEEVITTRVIIPYKPQPLVTVPDPIPIISVKPVIPTVPIKVNSMGEPVCDYDRQMFSGRSDLFWRRCVVTIPAFATAEHSSFNTVSPQ